MTSRSFYEAVSPLDSLLGTKVETCSCLPAPRSMVRSAVVWSLSAAAVSSAVAPGATEGILGSASREGKGPGAQSGVGIWYGEAGKARALVGSGRRAAPGL